MSDEDYMNAAAEGEAEAPELDAGPDEAVADMGREEAAAEAEEGSDFVVAAGGGEDADVAGGNEDAGEAAEDAGEVLEEAPEAGEDVVELANEDAGDEVAAEGAEGGDEEVAEAEGADEAVESAVDGGEEAGDAEGGEADEGGELQEEGADLEGGAAEEVAEAEEAPLEAYGGGADPAEGYDGGAYAYEEGADAGGEHDGEGETGGALADDSSAAGAGYDGDAAAGAGGSEYGTAAMGYSAASPFATQMHSTDAPSESGAIAEERARHVMALAAEARAREELEDMILRIEKHFKAEQAARKKAEELLQASIGAEMDAKTKLEEMVKRRSAEAELLEEEREAVRRERDALEAMRQEFDAELEAARSEVAKAQDALASTEERIRSAEAIERQRLEAEHERKAAEMAAEVARVREEMAYRMMLVEQDAERWRLQAMETAAAVLVTKDEVAQRKRELDITKEKLDTMLDKLMAGREKGLELGGGAMGVARLMMPPPPPGAMQAQLASLQIPAYGGWMGGPHAMPPPGALAPNSYHANGPKSPASGRATKLPPINSPSVGSPTVHSPSGYGQQDAIGAHYLTDGERSMGALSYGGGDDSDGEGLGQKSVDNYAHVKSRYAQKASDTTLEGKTKRTKSGRQGNRRNQPDRFAEAAKEMSIVGNVARWN